MSMKASTAALESSASRSLPNQRRAPRHPAGAKLSASAVGTQGSKEGAHSDLYTWGLMLFSLGGRGFSPGEILQERIGL
jgi:hypothetical protein